VPAGATTGFRVVLASAEAVDKIMAAGRIFSTGIGKFFTYFSLSY
jgi:hypothetical protein